MWFHSIQNHLIWNNNPFESNNWTKCGWNKSKLSRPQTTVQTIFDCRKMLLHLSRSLFLSVSLSFSFFTNVFSIWSMNEFLVNISKLVYAKKKAKWFSGMKKKERKEACSFVGRAEICCCFHVEIRWIRIAVEKDIFLNELWHTNINLEINFRFWPNSIRLLFTGDEAYSTMNKNNFAHNNNSLAILVEMCFFLVWYF